MRANFALDYDVLSVAQAQKLYLMAYLTAGPAPQDRQRRPLNLSLVIDRSGSMAGEKIDYTRQAAQLLVQNLGVRDILSIVLYNDTVETLLMPEYVQRKDIINQKIGNIKPGGTTNLSGGWLEGCNLVAQNFSKESLNRVILMSDGLANRGVTNREQLIALAQQKFGEGISTTTMGLGTDFNEDLMMEIASAGGGAFYFIESPEAAPLIFQEELRGLLSVVGQNLVIKVEKGEHVAKVTQLNAYPTHSEGTNISYRMGDVFGDEVKALLLELEVPAIKEIGQRQIATLFFDYDELNEQGAQHRTWEMPVIVNVKPGSETLLAANAEVTRSVMLLKAAQARRSAVESADSGRYQEASQMLRSVIGQIDAAGLSTDDQVLEERDALEKQASEMEQGAARYDDYSRKTMSTQAFYTMTSRHDETMVLRNREQKRQSGEPGGDAATEQSELVMSPPMERKPGVLPTHVRWQGNVYPLNGEIIRIGRSNHNEIVIGAKGVSRFHCQLKRSDGGLILEDVGSTNGTVVNGVNLIAPHNLSVGDEVRLCDERLVFFDEEDEFDDDTSMTQTQLDM